MEKLEFDILSRLAERLGECEGTTEMERVSADSQTVDHLKCRGWIDQKGITEAGLSALEPYKAQRAVFMAAGFGSRMVPITLNTPKPLVRVHGKRIIETLIDAVLAAGIEEIYIVRGYLGEQFELLLRKYPMIRLIENPDYDGTGTISSFYYAREFLDRAYVLESDLVVTNPRVIRKYHYTSDFLGTKVNETDDWYFKVAPDGYIREIGVGGSGDDCYKLIGMSYWDHADGKDLSRDIRVAYESPEGRKLPMSFVPFRLYKDRYRVAIAPCEAEDVVEIDSFKELQVYDESYRIKD